MKIKSFVALVLIFASSVFAQSLDEKVPADALVMVKWRGTLDPGPGYKDSHTQAILNSSDFVDQWNLIYINAIAELEKAFPDGKEHMESVKSLIPIIGRHPGMFYITIPEKTHAPTFMLFIQADDESKIIIEKCNQLAGKSPNISFFKVSGSGGLVTIAINPHEDTTDFKPLVQSEGYKKSLKHLQPDSFIHIYISMDEIIRSFTGMLETDKKIAQYMPIIMNVLKESGLQGLHTVSFAGGFANQNWEEQLFIDAPAPRTGLISLLEGKPFDADLLKHIPASSTQVTISRFDLMKLISEIKRLTTIASPEAGDILGKGIGIATLAIGKNIETDVIDPLGAEWAMYHSEAVGPDPLRQIVVVNKLDNGFKAKQGLTSLWLFCINTANTFVPPGMIDYKSETIKDNELTIFSWKFTGLAPSWTASNGYLYLGLDPKTIVSAARYKDAGIAENKTMQDLVTKLGQKDVISVAFFDTPKNVEASHRAMVDMIGEWNKIIPANFKLPPGEKLVPSVEILKQHSSPAAAVIWSDNEGIHGKTQLPYPLANMVSDAPYRKAISDGVNKTVEPIIQKAQQMQQDIQRNRPPSGGL